MEERRFRFEQNLRFGRELAGELASKAEQVAATFDALADLHEVLAGVAGHPLADGAAERAVMERDVAARERRAADWYRAVARRAAEDGGAASANRPRRTEAARRPAP